MRGMATAIALHSALGDNDVWFRRVVSLVSQQDGVRATRTQSSIAPEQAVNRSGRQCGIVNQHQLRPHRLRRTFWA